VSTPAGAAARNGPNSLSPPSIPGSRTSVRVGCEIKNIRRIKWRGGEAFDAVEDLLGGDDAREDVERGVGCVVEDRFADAQGLADREQDPVGQAGADEVDALPDGLPAPETEQLEMDARAVARPHEREVGHAHAGAGKIEHRRLTIDPPAALEAFERGHERGQLVGERR
jgi:hypothetical protein